MANNCLIEFDENEYGTFFTGQQLKGKVIFTLNKQKSITGIKLQINGYAQCRWYEKRGRKISVPKKKLKKRNVFFGHEDYIASTNFLEGSELGKSITIDAGTHTYSFACSIPIDCPSSYEGTYGHIRYTVKVTFIKHGTTNRIYTRGFTVLKLLDLNRESALLKSPACNESFQNVCLFNRKTVSLGVSVTQTGYVPGQMILINCQVNNESNIAVKNLLICLNLRATYMSYTPCMRTVYEKVCLVQKYCGPVAQQAIKNFAEIIRVPATPPTCDHLSKIVRLSYEVCVKALLSNLMGNIKAVIPVTIGTLPLIEPERELEPSQTNDLPTTSARAMQITEGDEHSSPTQETEVQNDLPPPSYEEAMYMTTNITDDNDANNLSENAQFTPRYPVYDIDSTVMARAMAQTPAPNPPLKRKKRRKQQVPAVHMAKEDTSTESPIEI